METNSSSIQNTSNSNWPSHFGLLYLISVFGFSLTAFHPGLLDYTLLPRYIIASFVFLLSSIFILIKSFTKNNALRWPEMDCPTSLLLSYSIWCTLSVAWATNFSEAIFESQKAIIGLAALYFCRWFQLNDPNFIDRLLKAMMIISLSVLFLAGWQIFQIDTSVGDNYYEVRGISGHKNLFSTVLFLLAGFLGIASFKLKDIWRKIALLLLFANILLCMYLRTRSVYLGIWSVVAISLFMQLRQRLQPKSASILSKSVIGLILLVIVTAFYLWQTNQLIPLLHASKIDQLWQSDTGSERLILWEKTACLIRQSPIWGAGAGNWQIEYPNFSVKGLYSVEMDFTTFQRPHNDWLWVWAETGIVGLICYLGFFLATLREASNQIKEEAASTNHMALITRYSFIVGFMIIACFSFPKERIEILLLAYTLLGLFYPMSKTEAAQSQFFTKLILAVIILSTALNLYIGQKRMVGENAVKKVVFLKQQKKWRELVVASDQAFSKWYTVDPTTIPIHWHRGTANFVLGKKEEALQDFLEAQKYTPFNQYLQNDLGTCFGLKGQNEKARMHYKESARISPSFDDPRINLAISYYNSGEFEQALGWLKNIRNKEIQEKYRKIITDKQQELNSQQ